VKEKQLDDLYQQYDEEASLPDQDALRERILRGFRTVAEWEWIRTTPLVKPYQLSMLILAVMHTQAPISSLEPIVHGGQGLCDAPTVEARLGELVRALELSDLYLGGASGGEDDDESESQDSSGDVGVDSGDLDPRLAAHIEFLRASAAKTNTATAREARFRAFHKAVAK
jgi:hypothetical protein